MKQWLLTFLILSAWGYNQAQSFSYDTIFFEFDRADLRSSDKEKLDSIIGDVTSYPSYFIQIFGHTDSIGTDAYNLELSDKRAKAVSFYLMEQGINIKRMDYEGLGTTKPVGSNITFSGRRKNRRADLAVVYGRDLVIPGLLKEDESNAENTANVEPEKPEPLIDTIYCDYQPFNVKTTKQTLIIAPQGASFTIYPNSFLTDAEEVSVQVNELFKREDMVKISMPTVSKEGPLEASGMVSLQARAGRKAIKISPENPILATVPSTRRDDDMGVYYGSGGTRGGARSRGRRNQNTQPKFQAVKGWNYEKELPIQYLGRRKAYEIKMNKTGRYAVARPLYYSQETSPDDKGVDFEVKFKGKRYPRTTSAMIMGEVVKTYIPLKKKDDRVYIASGVKFLDPAQTRLVLFAVQYDDNGNPWFAKRTFKVGSLAKKAKRKAKSNPKVKMKMKFVKTTNDKLNEIISEL